MEEEAKVGISASKVVALVGVLIIIRESILYFYTPDTFNILYGILALVFAAVIFISLELIDLRKVKIPYLWWLLLIFGVLLILFAWLSSMTYLGGTLVILAAILEILSKRAYVQSKIVSLVGALFAIYECVWLFMAGDVVLLVNGIFGIIFAIILILTLQNKIDVKIPYVWWVVLIIGFIIFTWVSSFNVGIGGTVILTAVILILMEY